MTIREVNEEQLQSYMATTISHVRFPGLNTIRAYAAVAVIIEHVSLQFPPDQKFFQILSTFFISSQNAVTLFFVLSGFLITYLLLNERAHTGNISIKNFYMRRVLRILPLYYLVTILGLIVFPVLFGPTYPLSKLPAYQIVLPFLLLPNFASLPVPMIHLWSIGVEEQYYALWPWASKKNSTLFKTVVGILITKILLTPVILSFHTENISTLFYDLRFECMAIGAIGAYVYLHNPIYKNWAYNPWVVRIAIGHFVYMSVFGVTVNTYSSIWFSFIFIILILNIATNPKSPLKFGPSPIEKMGEVSYGLYLYHFPVLYSIFFISQHSGFDAIWTSPFLLLVCTLGITWGIAVLSYRFFEMPFLNLKGKYATTKQ